MREGLKNISGRRIKVFAEVDRFGKKSAYRGMPLDTVCLINVKDIQGNPVCDHLWLIVRKQISKLNLEIGDNISFEARSKPYIKGYRGHREDINVPIEKDYKLSNPTNFVKLTKGPILPANDELF
ncbi:MAG: hypothetical protein PHT07_15610 [Paludibacter sp.]|nr:hypothetical protein [Paludibacter sp.]